MNIIGGWFVLSCAFFVGSSATFVVIGSRKFNDCNRALIAIGYMGLMLILTLAAITLMIFEAVYMNK